MKRTKDDAQLQSNRQKEGNAMKETIVDQMDKATHSFIHLVIEIYAIVT